MTLKQQIHEILELHPDLREEVSKRFNTFYDTVLEECGDCTGAFNEILKNVSYQQDILQPGSLPTVVASGRQVLIAAAALVKIYDCEALNTTSEQLGQSGWAGLNQDAKRWCRSLLMALPPDTATAAELRDIMSAKTLVGLVATSGIPLDPRSVKILPKIKGNTPPNFDQ